MFWVKNLKILKFFDVDRDPHGKNYIRDPGWKELGSGIIDKHPGSATLVGYLSVWRRQSCPPMSM
jgi:hypothetical protein